MQTHYLYSGNNSYKLVSNPFRSLSDPTTGWTVTAFDQNGRSISTQTFSGGGLPAPWGANSNSSGTVSTSYKAQTTTVTDQVGNQRTTGVDGLGRLASVIEYPGSGSYTTNYSYDALGDLTGVNQSGQTRAFVYDSQKRLIASTNPENYSPNNPPALGCAGAYMPLAIRMTRTGTCVSRRITGVSESLTSTTR